ncbi:hypothetical protein SXIM_37950 [Streptomyces xiamenensis]|uniref:Uncharacterized protein n=1 Tax=Streptomyces xiamenensis TaxID=408015 RepID=A0A0F7FXL0_9ACTN|nr:hypothetical protein SXIM_37950 [Streptomyces xiamenensis]
MVRLPHGGVRGVGGGGNLAFAACWHNLVTWLRSPSEPVTGISTARCCASCPGKGRGCMRSAPLWGS